MSWTTEEIENLKRMLLSVDERNVFLAFELMKNKEEFDIEPFFELLILIKLARYNYDYEIEQSTTFFLDKAKHLDKYQEVDILEKLFHAAWKHKDKKVFFKFLYQYEAASAIYEEYMMLNPDYADIYEDLIYTLKKFKANDLVLKYMKKSIEIQPSRASLHFNYAFALSDEPNGNVDEVIYHYEECNRLGLKDKAVKHNLACQYNQKKRNHGRAITLLEENLMLYPHFVESMLELSNAYSRSGFLDKAEEWLLRSLEIDSNFHSGYNNLAFFYWNKRQKYKEALDTINKAIEIEGNKGLYWHTLAEVEWYGFKNKEKALAALHKAMEVEPSYTAALSMIEEIEND